MHCINDEEMRGGVRKVGRMGKGGQGGRGRGGKGGKVYGNHSYTNLSHQHITTQHSHKQPVLPFAKGEKGGRQSRLVGWWEETPSVPSPPSLNSTPPSPHGKEG